MPKGIVTDGSYLWLVNDGKTDYVSRFTIVRDGSGNPTGLTGLTQWKLDSKDTKPTGLTIDPTGASDRIWVVDDGTNKVYEYQHARDGWSSAEGLTTFNLASGNTTPQDLADPRVFLASGQDGQDHIDTSLASLAVEFDNGGNLDFGNAATADPYATAAPADAATVEVINLATPVTNDLLWAA